MGRRLQNLGLQNFLGPYDIIMKLRAKKGSKSGLTFDPVTSRSRTA